MIKTWVNKALILAYITLFCFLGISNKVHAERLYILNNAFTNGDFSNGSTNWSYINYTNTMFSDGYNYGTFGNLNAYSFISNGYDLIENHKYYYNFNFYNLNISSNDFQQVRAYILGTNRQIFSSSQFFTGYKNFTGIYESLYNDTNAILIGFYKNNTNEIDTIGYGNLIFIDLTAIFGTGYEPSLQDFELYYLPDLNFFVTYNSFEPEMTTSITDVNYANIQENLTGIDYTKSIIDNDGKNIDLDLSLYFYDTVVNGVTIPGYYASIEYLQNNHPSLKYNGEIYTLNWVLSDYSNRVLILDLTDEEKLILKKILFNRHIDRDNEYFTFTAETSFFSYAKMWFTIGSKFDLLVDVKSFLLSRETVTQNNFNIINEMYIKTYDTDDNLLLPSLKMNIADLFRTVYVDDFGSQYTNISKFNFEFLITSPDTTDDYTEEKHYFYEIGIFSSDKVLHPSFIDSDIDSLWDYKTCDWYQIGCHLSNFFNDVLTTIYNKLNIDAIIAFFDGIIDDVSQVVDTVPSGVKTVFAVLFTGLSVALIIVIIEKMNR